jgi:hypothetical protein
MYFTKLDKNLSLNIVTEITSVSGAQPSNPLSYVRLLGLVGIEVGYSCISRVDQDQC